MNRLYYACFYAVIALLVANGIETKSHEGVKRMFGLHFIATHRLDVRHGRFFSQVLQARIQGDYDDFYLFDKAKCAILIEQGKQFISAIESLLLE